MTENDYVEMVREKEEKEKQEAERKKKRALEREEKKKEKERLKLEREKKKLEKQEKSKRGRRKRQVTPIDSEHSSEESNNESHKPATPPPREDGKRRCQPPSRYRPDSSDSEADDGVLCGICNSRDPPASSTSVIFWIDCDICDNWFHCTCAFGSSKVSKKYICSACS